jgi:zinc transport system substrate-binding protein
MKTLPMMMLQRLVGAALTGLVMLTGANSALSQKADSAAKPAETATVKIMTSFYPMYIATLNVAKGVKGVEVANLTRPQTGCLHDYQMTTEDMKSLTSANFFVINGAGMEAFLDKVLAQLPALKIIRASEGIEPIRGKGEESDNAHIWLSVSLHMKQVENIASQLAQADIAHASQYKQNAAEYISRLEQLRDKMREGLKDLRTRDIITFHEAFPYLAKEFNLNIAAVIEREPGSEPSARQLADTIRIVKNARVKALFAEPQYPAKAAEAIAGETGAIVYTLDPVVTGPMKANAYIESMEKNLTELQKALKQ